MLLERTVDAEGQIRCRADTERNFPLGQHADEFGILDRAHAVVDAVRAQQVDGVPHPLRATRFAGVNSAPQTGPARTSKGFGKSRPLAASSRLVSVDR